MKKTIEINDTLQEHVDTAIESVREELVNYLEQNDPEETPDMGNDLDYSGSIHEIIDGAVPIYTREIEDTFYLHGDDCERAFDDAGFEREGNWPMGWKAAAIYCYIEARVNEWYSENADDIFEEWQAAKAAAESDE